jgi:pSer/pThr/pTyr-binding forkhead associated (FHA) protein
VGTQAGPVTQAESTQVTGVLPATTPLIAPAAARLNMPGGHEIVLAGNARALGRQEFMDFMPADLNSYISRQHINIWYENGEYYIEDRSSTNGTRINSIDIKGTGRHMLADGDAIDLAGKLNIIFRKDNHKEEL